MTTLIAPLVKTATASGVDSIVAVVALAFSADRAARWACPDPHQYLTYFLQLIDRHHPGGGVAPLVADGAPATVTLTRADESLILEGR